MIPLCKRVAGLAGLGFSGSVENSGEAALEDVVPDLGAAAVDPCGSASVAAAVSSPGSDAVSTRCSDEGGRVGAATEDPEERIRSSPRHSESLRPPEAPTGTDPEDDLGLGAAPTAGESTSDRLLSPLVRHS